MQDTFSSVVLCKNIKTFHLAAPPSMLQKVLLQRIHTFSFKQALHTSWRNARGGGALRAASSAGRGRGNAYLSRCLIPVSRLEKI